MTPQTLPGPQTATGPQNPMNDVDLAANPEPRVPCVLLLDTSKSMEGAPIEQLKAGLETYRDALGKDPRAAKTVEVAIVTFGGDVKVASDFAAAGSFQPPALAADGKTPMGGAIQKAFEILCQQKSRYKAKAVPYVRPWMFLITDGAPTDDWKTAADMVKVAENNNDVMFYSVAVEKANLEILKQISKNAPIQLKGLDFSRLFQWLSSSQTHVGKTPPPFGKTGN